MRPQVSSEAQFAASRFTLAPRRPGNSRRQKAQLPGTA
jgi:hypothetical protein